jgi:hypothetical protein
MQQCKLKELERLMNFINTSKLEKKSFKDYIAAYRYTHPLSSIDFQVVTEKIREPYWDCNFA